MPLGGNLRARNGKFSPRGAGSPRRIPDPRFPAPMRLRSKTKLATAGDGHECPNRGHRRRLGRMRRRGHAVARRHSGRILRNRGRCSGGRARRVDRAGLPLDNGQHLLLGAYDQTLAIARCRPRRAVARAVVARSPLSIVPFAAAQADALTLVPAAPKARWACSGTLGARGLTWRERIANIAWMRELERTGFVRPPYETVAPHARAAAAHVARGLWEPLCLAAFNTPPSAASAQIFANVLKAVFAGRAEASDFLLPATDLSAMFPEAAARFVESRGGVIRTSAPRARSCVPRARTRPC